MRSGSPRLDGEVLDLVIVAVISQLAGVYRMLAKVFLEILLE